MSKYTDSTEVFQKLKNIVGEKNFIDDVKNMDSYLIDWRNHFSGLSPLILMPTSTRMISDILAFCNKNSVPVLPQGGNTGLVGGGVPSDSGNEVIISLEKMNAILDIDPINYTMTVEAGCILSNIQDAAFNENRIFPLSLAAEGSCQIGGNLATNAGGTGVLRYGNAKELVLGLEVVLADGSIVNSLKQLRKDNTGYDLKHLFLGSEGTLGIITAAVLKLFPKPQGIYAAYCAVSSVSAAIELLNRARTESGDCVETFELISRLVMDLVLKHIPNSQDPLNQRYQHYVLLELVSTAEDSRELYNRFETILGKAMEAVSYTHLTLPTKA